MNNQPSNTYDIIIIGGGPAALTATIYARRKELSTLMIAEEVGGQLLYSSEVENYPGFESIQGYDLMKKIKEHVNSYNPETQTSVRVSEVTPQNGKYTIHTNDDQQFETKTIVVASGGRWRKLQVPGEEELTGKGLSYCTTCDGPLFTDRDVAVIGGGNSGFEGIIDLLPIANKVINIDVAPEPIADPILQKRVEGEGVDRYYNHEVLAILGDESVEGIRIKDREDGTVRELELDGIFVEIGLIPNSDFVEHLVQTNDKGEIIVDCKSQTNQPGIFAAGDVTNVPEKQVVISAGEGAKAALGAYRYLIRSDTDS